MSGVGGMGAVVMVDRSMFGGGHNSAHVLVVLRAAGGGGEVPGRLRLHERGMYITDIVFKEISPMR